MMMTSGTQLKYNGGIDCGLQIIKKEGVMALMKGAGTNIVFILTSSVIEFLFFKRILNGKH